MNFIKKWCVSYFKYLSLLLLMLMAFNFSIFGLTKNGIGVYQIKTREDLIEFADMVNSGKTRISAALCNDIDLIDPNSEEYECLEQLISDSELDEIEREELEDRLEDFVWTPIGKNKEFMYSGNFFGRNYTIRGIYGNGMNHEYFGLFGVVGKCGKIRDVKVKDFYFDKFERSNGFIGGVVANILGVGCLENCSSENIKIFVENINIDKSSVHIGGVVGSVFNDNALAQCFKQTTKNCKSNNIIIRVKDLRGIGDISAGGVIGDFFAPSTIDSCESERVDIKVEDVNSEDGDMYVAGVVGQHLSTIGKTVFSNCKSKDVHILLKNNRLEDSFVGGISGVIFKGQAKECRCENINISVLEQNGDASIGGISGCIGVDSTEIDKCKANNINIEAKKNNNLVEIGGIVGVVGAGGKVINSNSDDIEINLINNLENEHVGGITGRVGGALQVVDCDSNFEVDKLSKNMVFSKKIEYDDGTCQIIDVLGLKEIYAGNTIGVIIQSE